LVHEKVYCFLLKGGTFLSKTDVTVTLGTLEQFLLDLPETALEDARIHRWMRSEAIDHYQDHRLPAITEER
jgi:hypothetical protein